MSSFYTVSNPVSFTVKSPVQPLAAPSKLVHVPASQTIMESTVLTANVLAAGYLLIDSGIAAGQIVNLPTIADIQTFFANSNIGQGDSLILSVRNLSGAQSVSIRDSANAQSQTVAADTTVNIVIKIDSASGVGYYLY